VHVGQHKRFKTGECVCAGELVKIQHECVRVQVDMKIQRECASVQLSMSRLNVGVCIAYE